MIYGAQKLVWRKLSVSKVELDINIVLTCGQSFRWKCDKEKDPLEWTGVFGNRLWTLKQSPAFLFYKAHPHPTLQNLTKNESEELLNTYFNISIKLSSLYSHWSKNDERFRNLTASDYQGIRILKQDPIENIFSFICSSNNHISRISSMVEKLCTFYGDIIGQIDNINYYSFPSVEKLKLEEVEERLRKEGFGYRAAFIVKSAGIISEKGGEDWTKKLEKIGYDAAVKELQSLAGVGRKVADCVCLMSLNYHSSIPIDTHIHAVGKEYLPHLKNIKSLTDKVYTEISDYFRNIHGEYAGWAQAVLFTSRLRHLKPEKVEKAKKSQKRKAKDGEKVEKKRSRKKLA